VAPGWGDDLLRVDFKDSVANYRRALEIDPQFHQARIIAAAAHINQGYREEARRWLASAEERLEGMTPYERTRVQYLRARLELDLEGALEADRRALELAPQMDWLRLNIGLTAVWLNRPREAVEVLRSTEFLAHSTKYFTAWWPFWVMTDAHHMLGDYEQELGYANLGLERFPNRGGLFRAKARALAAMGQVEAVSQLIDEYLSIRVRGPAPGDIMTQLACELRAHGHREASVAMAARAVEWVEGHRSVPVNRLRLAKALVWLGRSEDARVVLVELAEQVRVDSPLEVRGQLGTIAALLGDRDEARRIADSLPVDDDPFASAWRYYWHACIAAHLGDKDRAIELLTDAASEGGAARVGLHSEPELEPLWDYPPFQELIRPKG
jgi:tetratricopeptide (TPR) repeat protein